MLERLFQARAIETSTPANPSDWLTDLWAGSTTSNTGATVSTATAMTYGAVYACVRILAESISSLPLIMYQRRGDARERATHHPLYRLLHDAPNPEMTRTEMWETMIGLLALWGNSYAEIVRDKGWRVKELWPLDSSAMTVKRESGELWYYYVDGGVEHKLPPERILHLRGLSSEGLVGYSPIYMAREAIGLGLATEEYGARLFANDARPGGFWTSEKRLNANQRDLLKSSFNTDHQGLANRGKLAVVPAGISWQQVGMPNDDAQFLETRKFQVTEIARWFRIPPHMLADLERATFSNIEHQSLEFVMHTLRPWMVRIEQRINQSLLTEQEQRSYYVEHLVDGLLRGAINDRYTAYATGRQNGWLSANDIRALENMNPIAGGDEYLIPLNMEPVGEADIDDDDDRSASPFSQVPGARTPADLPQRQAAGPRILTPREARAADVGTAENRRRIAQAYRKLVANEAARLVAREQRDILRKGEKLLRAGDVAGFLSYLEDFYRDHPAVYAEYMTPVLESLAEQIAVDAYAEIEMDGEFTDALRAFLGEYMITAADKYCNSNHGQLRQVVNAADEGEELAALQERFDEWTERTPGKQANRQTVRSYNAITRQAWIGAGILAMRWQTHGESCPYCNALAGQVVTLQEAFLKPGEFLPDGAEAPLTVTRTIHHPPAHDGCDCGIGAVI